MTSTVEVGSSSKAKGKQSKVPVSPDTVIVNLNKEAKSYQPKSKKGPSHNNYWQNKLKALEERLKHIEVEEESEDEIIEQEFVKDCIKEEMMKAKERGDDLDSESEDEDKWYPDFSNCECCEGYIYACVGETCRYLGMCYCKMKVDLDK